MKHLRRPSMVVLAVFSFLLVLIFTLNQSAAAEAEALLRGDVSAADSTKVVATQPQRQADRPVPQSAAKDLIRRAWEKARAAGAYEFDADVSQIRRPLASVMNVGRQSEREEVYLEGVTDVNAQRLEMTLWMNGGSVQDKSTGSEIRVEGDQAYARRGGQDWEEISNFTGLFAPNNDFMAYLVAAVNVRNLGHETRAGVGFTRIAFDIDGPAYARHLRDEMQAEMRRQGDLPPGMSLSVPELYSGMTGSGELWIGDDGLPLRQSLQLEFPPDEERQTSAQVTVNFREFLPSTTPAAAESSPAATVADKVASMVTGAPASSELITVTNQIVDLITLLVGGIVFVGVFAIMLLYSRRSRAVLAALQLILISAMLFTPLIRSAQAAEYLDLQQARQEVTDAREQDSEMVSALESIEANAPEFNPGTLEDILNDPGTDSDLDGYTDVQEKFLGTNPVLSASGATRALVPELVSQAANTPEAELPPDDGTDSDSDGLTDYVESLLGTSVVISDTDGDLISDWDEVTGFVYNNVTWTTDPLEMDTNRDGIGDGQEWYVNAANSLPADSDNDGTPDLFDLDNDGDGVPDSVDLSPGTKVAQIYDRDNPFPLVINGLNDGMLTYVEIQLRPVISSHLQYAYNRIDWPDGDVQGNIQDFNNSKEDVQLLPMLEVVMPDASSYLLPDAAVLNKYRIMVQDLPGNEQAIYVPLNLTTENQGARRVAFSGKMLYQGDASWGDPHQYRLVWMVQAKNDVCDQFDDSGNCDVYSQIDEPQVIHTYDDTWRITGLNVQENHGSEIATVFEDPAVDTDLNNDDSLWQLSYGLDLTFTAGATITETAGAGLWDVAEIERRFDHDTNNGVPLETRWNISDTLTVVTESYGHVDEAVITTVQTKTLELLATHFISPGVVTTNPVSPTFLFARHDRYRSLNLDEDSTVGSWGTNTVALQLAGSAVPVEKIASVNWAPFRYDTTALKWEPFPIDEYWEHLGERLSPLMAAEYADPEEAGGAVILSQIYYMGLVKGVSNIVQIGDQGLKQSFYGTDREIGASIASGGRFVAVRAFAKWLENGASGLSSKFVLTGIFKTVKSSSNYALANPIGTLKRGFAGLKSAVGALNGVRFGLAMAAVVLVAAAVVVGLAFLIKEALGEEAGGAARITSAVIVGAVSLHFGVIAPLAQIRAFAGLYQTAQYGSLSASAALSKAAKSAESVSKAAKAAAVLGLVVGIGIAWGIFFSAISGSGPSAGSVAFNALLAQAIAATIIALIQFALSLTIVGSIIVAIMAIVDLLLYILGVNFSLNGWLTETLGRFIYHFELTIDQIVDTGEPSLSLVDPNRGLVDGAMMAATMPVSTTIWQKDPEDFWGWRVLPYLPAYYTPDNLRSTTFKYTLTPNEGAFNVGRNEMRTGWGSFDQNGVYLPNQLTVHHELGYHDMSQGINIARLSTNVPLTAGVNQPLPLYLNSSYAMPGVECWTIPLPFFPYLAPLCLDKTIKDNSVSDLGSSLIFDVLPDTLDEFVALDWGGNMPFGPQQDWDNDGLVNRDANGNDPNDFEWDSDGDLLADDYELRMRQAGTRLKPLNPDTDFDGLSDLDEIRFGTDPDHRDTDRDGLDDGEEVWHFDTRTLSWQGGWTYTATYTNSLGAADQQLAVRIFSDPLQRDADGDGLSDGVEKALHILDPQAYPFHPSVFNITPVALYLTFSDEDGYIKPDQTFIISATVRNNLSSPLFARGVQTLTLPAELDGTVLSGDFNVFQAQESSINASVTVPSLAPAGEITITANYLARLHDGDLSWTYRYLPRVPDDTDVGVVAAPNEGAYYARLAQTPADLSYDFALAGLEAPNHPEPYSADRLNYWAYVLGNGSAMARRAGVNVGSATPVNVPVSDGPTPPYLGSKVGWHAPDIACNAQGECAQAFVDVSWKTCADVYFDYMHVTNEDDAGSVGEYGLVHFRLNPNPTSWFDLFLVYDRFFGWVDGGDGDDLTIDRTVHVCAGDGITAYEEDDSPNSDDNLGTLTFTAAMLAPHDDSRRYQSGDDVTVYYRVQPNPIFTGKLARLNSNLNPDGSPIGFGSPLANPAVATSGNRWLAGFETTDQTGRMFVYSVSNDFSSTTGNRLDEDSVGSFNDHNLDIVWAGTHYLAVWERDFQGNDHDIEMALVNENGVPSGTIHVDRATTKEETPSVAYSPHQDQSMVVYVSNNTIVGKRIEGSRVGPRFDIATPGGASYVTDPDVAYDGKNNVWVVSWLSGNNCGLFNLFSCKRANYVVLSPGTLDSGATALLPSRAVTAFENGLDSQSLACAYVAAPDDPNLRVTSQCAIVTSRSNEFASTSYPLTLDTLLLESIPPWIGGPLDNSVAGVLTVDLDAPTATITSLANGDTLNITDTFGIGGKAGDATSGGVASVQVSIDSGQWMTASGEIGLVEWGYTWNVPHDDGPHTIAVRATDLVGRTGAPSVITVNLDRSAPVVNFAGTANDFVTATFDNDGRWHVNFAGTASDALSAVSAVEATISPAGNGWQTATLTSGSGWALDYVLPEFDDNNQKIANPTGDFMLIVRARDEAGNVTESNAYATWPFRLDTTPPEATLTDFGPSFGVISQTLTLSGLITDSGDAAAGIQQLEIDFVPTGQVSDTWTPVALASSGPGVINTTWSHPVPVGLEGNYSINLRGTDVLGNQASEGQWWSNWQGEIDTLAPRAQVTVTLLHNGSAAKTYLEATIYDRNLTEDGLEFPCDVWRADRGYESDPFLNSIGSGQVRLASLNIDCQIDGFVSDPITLRAFDRFGHETVQVVTPPSAGPTVSAFEASTSSLGGFSPATAAGVVLPDLAATVLTPTHESAIIDISLPLTIEGGAYAINSLKALTLTINGAFHYATSWSASPVVTDALWSTTWTPPGDGTYELVTTVEDWTGAKQSDPEPVMVYVDTAPPVLTLATSVLTDSHRLSYGRFELNGTAIDSLGLEAVTVAIDGGPAMAADLDDPNWRYVWILPSDPDNETHNAVITAYDAGNTTIINTNLVVDVLGPQGMSVTTGYSDGGTPTLVYGGDTVTDVADTHLTTAWTEATDGSGLDDYRVGWTASPTPVLSALTAYPNASASHATAVSEATRWFAHTIAFDTVGNRSAQTIGPVFIDAPTTPDYINPDDGFGDVYRGWMDSGCSLIGADYQVARYAPDGAALNTVQRFYATWDAANLRLAWTGADWRVDGDLFIYLDTGSGGATQAYNPYGAGAAIALPDEGSGQMAADYLIYVEDGESAILYNWDGSAWLEDRTLAAPNVLFDPGAAAETTDLYIPFTWIGSPSALKLVALASEEDALRLWAAMPDHNPLNSQRAVNPVAWPALDLPFALTQHYQWTNVGDTGVCPASGQFEDASLRFELVAEPAGVSVGFLQHDLPGLTPPSSVLDSDLDGNVDVALPLDVNPVPVGLGTVVSYTLHYANDGLADATGVVANVTARGGLASLSPSSISLGTIPAGTSGSVEFTAAIDPSLDGESAEIKVAVSDAVHAPLDWLWAQHDIDSVGPTNVEIVNPIAYIGVQTSTISGVASDASGIPAITLRTNGATTQTCVDLTPYDGEWNCLFDAGGATDGTTFQLDALGTDEWGNVGSYGPAVTLVVDTVAPSISLNAATEAMLGDGLLAGGELLLGGSVTDDRAADGAEICALADGETLPTCIRVSVSPRGQATANWSANVPIPASADGELYTLTFYGLDAAGNRTSSPETRTVAADYSGPDIQIATQPEIVAQYSTRVALAGTITDGSGVANLTLHKTLPDNNDGFSDEFEKVVLGAGSSWSHSMTYGREGDYKFGLFAADVFGNETSLGTFTTEAVDVGINVPPTADTGGPYSVGEGETLTLAGIAEDLNVLAGQTITYAWDLDNNGTFETADTLTPVFDATNIDGPDQRTIRLRVSDGEYTDTDSTTVTIRNLAPSADAGGPYTVGEGAQLTLNGSGSDPYPGDSVSFAWDIDNDGDFSDASGTTAVFPATGIDGPAVDSVSLKVTDDDGGFTIATAVITITNVPPELANLYAAPIPENHVATLTGSIIDPAAQDSFDLEIVWGDGRGTTVAIAPVTATGAGIADVPGGAAGNQILRLDSEVLSEGGFQHRFENVSVNGWLSQDWSSYDGISFWYYGTGTGTDVFVEIYDNRNSGSTIDDAERWRYEFSDDTAGWQQISALFTAFERVEDEVGAPNDGLGLTEVWGWALGTHETSGIESRFVDDFSLTFGGNPTLVDEFESGLPSGVDGDGITVGFSPRSAAWDGTSYYQYPAGTTTFSESHLYIDDDDDDSYTVDLLIRDDDGGESTASTAITVYNVAPAVTFSPTTQTVQYSDYIGSIVITVTDVVSDPLAISTSWSVDGGGSTAGLFDGVSLATNGCVNNLDYTQTCTWSITGIADVPAGDYVIAAELTDDDGGMTVVDIPVNVTAEDSVITFDGDNPVAVQVTEPESNASLPFEMVVYVEELEPDRAAFQAAPGDITLADVSMTLEPVGPGGGATGDCTPVLIDDAANDYGDVLRVVCTFAGVPVNTYSVNVLVDGGYYAGYSEDVLVIYDPSLGFTTGGGWFYWPGTADLVSGYLGDKTNFGYSMSYNQKNLKNVRGSLLLIRHLADGTKYRVKSNALEGLSIGDVGTFGWASFSGKATYMAPEPEFLDANLGQYVPKGNYTFLAYVEDHNEPGNGIDEFWIEVREPENKGGGVVAVSSLDRPGSANSELIQAGNIVVPHSGIDSGNLPPTAGFSFTTTGLNVTFADESTDFDGTIFSWNWNFGDGSSSTAQSPSHGYASSGTYNVTLTVMDNEGASESVSRQVTVSGGNEPPIADFSYAVTGLSVSFSDLSSDPDGTIATWSWDFGDGNSSPAQSPSHTFLASGTYDVLLTVTDNGGASDTFGQQVTVSDGGGLTAMYIASMIASSTPDGGGSWNAVVTIQIVDENGDPVVNATVNGQWSKGFYQSSSCTTDASGQCSVEQTGIDDRTRRVTFTVDNVTHSAFTYNSTMNFVSSVRVDRP